MVTQKGIAAVLILLVIAAVALVGLLIASNVLTIPGVSQKQIDRTIPSDVKVTLQTEYENPFEEKTQYSNPFSDYQNPFDGLK